MKVLIITTEWPTLYNPISGIFISQQIEFLRQADLKVTIFHYSGNFNPINYLKAWWNLHFRIDQSKFDIVHVHWGYAALPVFPKKTKLVITYHGSDLQGIVTKDGNYLFFKSMLSRLVSQISSLFANQSIVVSKKLAQYLPDNSKIEIIHGGIDLKKFFPMNKQESREMLGLPPHQKIVIFPSDPENPVKRFDLAKKTIEMLSREIPDIYLLPLKNIPHEDVPKYLNAADALLLTSYHEGSPTVVKEAICCNLPVVSVNVGDVEEQLMNLSMCYVVDDPLPEKMSNCLLNVLSNNSRPDYSFKFNELDEENSVKRIIEIYNNLLKE